MDTNSQGRLVFLDSLRGLAALYVVAFHMLMIPGTTHLDSRWASQLVHFGGTGVFLFFVLSGFSLSMTMPRHQRYPWPVVSYSAARIFRIAPLYYLVLATMALGWLALTGYSLGARTVALDAAFLFNLVPGKQEGIVWASWTIGVEMLFYVAFPLLYRLRVMGKVAVVALALMAFAAERTILPPSYTWWSVVGFAPMFIVGMLAFDALLWLRARDKPTRIGAWLGAGGLVLLIGCALPTLAEKEVWLRLPIAAAYAMILLGFGLRPWPVIEARPFTFYGRISYSVYLLHAPVVWQLHTVYAWIFREVSGTVAFPLCYGITLAFVTPLAFATFKWIEHPAEKLKYPLLEWLARRWRRAGMAVTTSTAGSPPALCATGSQITEAGAIAGDE